MTRLNEEFANEKISTLMTRLQMEILTLILRMANEFPQRKEQLIFIINNYDLLLSVLTVMKRTSQDRILFIFPRPIPMNPLLNVTQ